MESKIPSISSLLQLLKPLKIKHLNLVVQVKKQTMMQKCQMLVDKSPIAEFIDNVGLDKKKYQNQEQKLN